MNKVEQFRGVANELTSLYEKKNACYGDSFGQTYAKLGVISAVTRISDKYNRLCALATNKDLDNLGESIEDTLIDLAAYAIMTLVEHRNANKKNETTPDDDKKERFMCINPVKSGDGGLAFIQWRVYDSVGEYTLKSERGDTMTFLKVTFDEHFVPCRVK